MENRFVMLEPNLVIMLKLVGVLLWLLCTALSRLYHAIWPSQYVSCYLYFSLYDQCREWHWLKAKTIEGLLPMHHRLPSSSRIFLNSPWVAERDSACAQQVPLVSALQLPCEARTLKTLPVSSICTDSAAYNIVHVLDQAFPPCT